MTKADLVERASDAVGPRVTKKDCGLVVDAFLDAVKDALERGEGIEIRGFGTFKVRSRKPRTAITPISPADSETSASTGPSSGGTTMSTATGESRCLRQPMSLTAGPRR